MKSGQHGGNVREKAEQYGFETQDIVDFSANINPLGMPAELKQAIVNKLDDAHLYPDIDYVNLHKTIALATHCAPEQVLAGNGATELIYLWVKHINPQCALLVEPTFAEYRRALTLNDASIVTYQLTYDQKFIINESILNELHQGLDALVLCSPNNPTGALIPQSLLTRILEKCLSLNVAVLLDESFIDFSPDMQSAIGWINEYPNLTVLQSLTKFYAIPGIRLGYMVSSNTALIEAIHSQREPWSINAFAVIAGETVFDCHDYQHRTHDWLKDEYRYLYSQLNTFSQLEVWPSTANYLFFRCHNALLDLQDLLMQHGILIRSCANYPGLDNHYYRVAIKSHSDNQRLVKALTVALAS
ncbi:threonine-phosphate decarboxylase CobD [Vibrio sp. WJH972]